MKNNLLNNKTSYISNFFIRINWIVYFFLLVLAFIGSVILYSVSQGSFYPLVSSHLVKFLISSFALFITCFIRVKFIFKYSYLIYLFSLFLLIIVLIFGNNDYGANRWLNFGGFAFQPSELSKITVIILLSRYYHDYQLINKMEDLQHEYLENIHYNMCDFIYNWWNTHDANECYKKCVSFLKNKFIQQSEYCNYK